MQLFLAGPEPSYSSFINIERLSDRVLLAYWVGMDRRCNLTAIKKKRVTFFAVPLKIKAEGSPVRAFAIEE